jgi:segregation and condensation protein A
MQEDRYSVTLPVFTGPLDLLLRLIEREELDITKVALADVTDQYIAYISGLDERSVEGLADFLVLAARLVLIKSQALLPQTLAPGLPEPDPGEELARQLRMYRKFKQAAQLFMVRQSEGARTFVRLAAPPRVRAELDLSGVSINDLGAALTAVLDRPVKIHARVSEMVGRPRFSVRGRVRVIARSLGRRVRTSFFRLLGNDRSRGEIVATFLAILELSRRNMVVPVQEERFGDIQIVRQGDWRESDVRALDAELDSNSVEPGQ